MRIPRLKRYLWLGLALSFASSCDRFSAETRDNRTYVNVMMPILQDNSLLAERVLVEAAGVYNEKSEPEALVQNWTDEITPLAEHVHSQASFATPPESWSEQHAKIVDIWGQRAQAYRALSDAIQTADDTQWQSSRDQADGVKLAEEKWFESTNKRLVQSGLVLDQFP